MKSYLFEVDNTLVSSFSVSTQAHPHEPWASTGLFPGWEKFLGGFPVGGGRDPQKDPKGLKDYSKS